MLASLILKTSLFRFWGDFIGIGFRGLYNACIVNERNFRIYELSHINLKLLRIIEKEMYILIYIKYNNWIHIILPNLWLNICSLHLKDILLWVLRERRSLSFGDKSVGRLLIPQWMTTHLCVYQQHLLNLGGK